MSAATDGRTALNYFVQKYFLDSMVTDPRSQEVASRLNHVMELQGLSSKLTQVLGDDFGPVRFEFLLAGTDSPSRNSLYAVLQELFQEHGAKYVLDVARANAELEQYQLPFQLIGSSEGGQAKYRLTRP